MSDETYIVGAKPAWVVSELTHKQCRTKPPKPHMLLAAVLTLLLVAALLPMTSQPANSAPVDASPQSLQCGPIYTMQGTPGTSAQNVWEVDTASGAQTSRGNFGLPTSATQINAMGMSADGTSIFGVYLQNNNREIFTYDTNTNSSEKVGRGPASAQITHGAVNPKTGTYYYGGISTSGSSTFVLNVYGFNPATGESLGLVAQGQVPAKGGNGDFAFSNSGELYYIGADTNGLSTLGVVNEELPTTKQSQALVIDATEVATINASAPINGVAFGGDGLLYLGSGTTLYGADATSGSVVSESAFRTAGTTDMASCATPSTLQVQKDFSNGRFVPGDQTTLSIAGNGLEPGAPGNTGETRGSENGIQDQQASETAGSIIGRPGQTFQISETGAGASQTNYKSSYECVNERNGETVATGDGTDGDVTIPQGGADLVCTFANDAQRPDISLQKSAELNDENGNGVADAGETIEYTFKATNTGNTTLDNVKIADKFDFDAPGVSPASADGLKPQDSTEFTAKYTVTPEDVDSGKEITNTATASGESPTGQNATSAESKANTPVATRAPGLSLEKTNELDDSNGNRVADANETINYSFTVRNIGNTTLTNVSINDSKIEGTDPESVATLAPGAEATFSGSYKVTQDDVDGNGTDGSGVIRNTATASGNTAGQDEPIESEKSSTNTPLPAQTSSIGLKKTSELDDSNDNNVADVDESIKYSFTVTNTGNTTLTNVSIADEFDFDGAGIDPTTIDSLAPGDSATFSANYTVKQSDVDAGGVIENTATASGDNPAGDPTESGPSSTDTPVAEPISALSLDKEGELGDDVDGNGIADVGDTLKYTFSVTNNGNTTLKNITIDDDRIDSTDPAQIDSLAPGESAELTATYTVTQADIDSDGDIVNTATASGSAPNGDPVKTGESSDNVPTAGHDHALSVQKDGVLDDGNDNGTADAGETIDYTFTVTNNGNTTLTKVTVVDDRIDAGTLSPSSVDSLAPGEDATFTGSRLITQDDIDAGVDIVNTATASGTPPDADEPITSTESVDNVPVTAQTNGLALQKTSSIGGDKDAAEVGDVIDFTFTVTNTGNTTLKDVSIADEFDFDSGIDPGSIATLAPGEKETFTASYTVTQNDVDSGKDVTNTAAASGTAPNDDSVKSNDSTANTPVIPQSYGIAISKTADLDDSNGNGVADAGETIKYTFVVTNTGNTTLTDVTVKDDRIDDGTLAPGSVDSLAPGDQATFTASLKVTQQIIDQKRGDGDGAIVNIAHAEGTTPGDDEPIKSSDASANVPLAPQAPGLHLEKTGALQDDGEVAKVGDTIEYTFVVTNTGNTTVTDVGINDDRVDDIKLSDPGDLPNGLAPGETATFTGSYKVTQDDIDSTDSTEIINTATAHGQTPGDDETESGPSTANTPKSPRDPHITLEKTGEIQDAEVASVGDKVEYTFTVTNSGNTTLSDVSIDDPKVGDVDPASVDSLAPGDSTKFTATYTVTQADVDAGGVQNTATATGTTPDDSAVDAVDTDGRPVVSPDPSLKLDKSNQLQDENGNDAADVGEAIKYTFKVENTGNITLHNIIIKDDRIDEGTLEPSSVDELAPGDTATFTARYRVTQADVDSGESIVNTATAETKPEGDEAPVVSDEDSTKTPVADRDGRLSLEKSNELQDDNGNDAADVGETIGYTFVVENTGNTTLTDVTVEDDRIDEGTLDPGSVTTLAPGDSATFTASHTVTQADVDKGAPVKNTATAVGTDPGDDEVRSAEDSTETPVADTDASLSIEKTADQDVLVAGETIEYSFKVVNTGNVTLTDVGVAEGEFSGSGDLSDVSCPDEASSLAPGDSVTCSASYEVTQSDVDSGSLDNSATAKGKGPGGDDVSSDPSEAKVPAPDDDSDDNAGTDDDSSANAGDNADANDSDQTDADASSGSDDSANASADAGAASASQDDGSSDSNGGGDLPRTGATGIMTAIAIALLLVAVGAVIVMAVRRRRMLS